MAERIPKRTPMACQFCRGIRVSNQSSIISSYSSEFSRTQVEMRRSADLCKLSAPRNSMPLRTCVSAIGRSMPADMMH